MEISNEFLMRAMVAAVLIAEISREFTFYNNSKIALNSHSVVKMWFRKSYSVSTLDLSNKSSPEFYFGSQGLKHYKSLKKNLNCLNHFNLTIFSDLFQVS